MRGYIRKLGFKRIVKERGNLVNSLSFSPLSSSLPLLSHAGTQNPIGGEGIRQTQEKGGGVPLSLKISLYISLSFHSLNSHPLTRARLTAGDPRLGVGGGRHRATFGRRWRGSSPP